MSALVIKCTWGLERPETLFQAFTVAATAASAGNEVSLWLTGDAVWHAVAATPDATLDHSPNLSVLRETVLASGRISVCAQCAARRSLTEADLIPGARIAGAAAFVEESLSPGATALVY
ncbi:DsrE family protein [Demequina sp.]|uniref:DsrE family protein n=1 Tax=Demequina sp. TaxID=2050685 RepID=UPI003D0DB89B